MQELLECQYKNGCAGGASQDAYTFAAANGLESEEDYPYTCLPGGNCPSKHKCSRTVPGGAGPAPAIQIDGVRLLSWFITFVPSLSWQLDCFSEQYLTCVCISAGAAAAAQRRGGHARRPGEARSDHGQHRRDADAHAALLLRRMGRRLMLPADESCGARRGQSADAYRGPSVAYSLRPLRLRHTTRPCSLASELTGRVLAGWLDRAGRRLRFDRDAGVQLHCLGAYLDLRAVISQRTLPPALS
jgi:hypothetical protein